MIEGKLDDHFGAAPGRRLQSFDEHCARWIEPDRDRIRRQLERSLMLVTALPPFLGYDRAAEFARKAHREGLTLKEAAVAMSYSTAEEYDWHVRPEAMVTPLLGE